MSNKLTEEPLLTEYQACQQDVNSSGQQYWTLTGIFIGVTSVLLGGILYGLISNDTLFNGLLGVLTSYAIKTFIPLQIFVVSLIIMILGLGMVYILNQLKLWLSRVRFLQQLNYYRMREIERQLGMWKSWRVHGVDNWNKLEKYQQEYLIKHHEQKWWLEWGSSKHEPPYAKPNSKGVYTRIILVLQCIWGIFTLMALVVIVRQIIWWVI